MLEYRRNIGPTDDAAERLAAYLGAQGFNRTMSGRVIAFTRGTRVQTSVAFSPAQWKSDLEYDLSTGNLLLRVSTLGQIVTPAERRYFEAFLDELTVALSKDDFAPHTLALRTRDMGSDMMARRALAENVSSIAAFGLAWPAFTLLLYAVVSVPALWAFFWGFAAAAAATYAWVFSIRRRRDGGPQP